jgi:ABC-type transporter Mla MlaB component
MLPRLVEVRRESHFLPGGALPWPTARPQAVDIDREEARAVEDIYLKHMIDLAREANGARLVLDGDLTQMTVARLTEKLEAAGARPQVIDAGRVRFADLAALTALLRWARRAGISALRIVNAPRELVELSQRFEFSRVLPLEVRPALRSLRRAA